jgi:uncharacterized protein YbaR (Trm112 family)
MLVCPDNKEWPLKVHIFEERAIEKPFLPKADNLTKVVCTDYCPKKEIILTKKSGNEEIIVTKDASKINYETDCKECLSSEIVAGLIECPSCKVFYPIFDEIPLVLKKELRNEDIERQFTEKWSEEIKKLKV